MRRFLLAILCGCVSAFGWGGEGHDLVARIAWEQLTAKARARVQEILGPNVTLASISSWADQVRNQRRETGTWHYIDIPINQPHLDMARDCPKGDCVLAKIEDFRKALKDPATDPAQRREALLFVVHFVGDMHQPLHCSDNKDNGGNGVRVQFADHAAADRPSNLHSVWDSGFLSRMPQKEDALFAEWSKDSAKHAKKWAKGTVYDWAEDAHKQSVKITYGGLPKTHAAGTATAPAAASPGAPAPAATTAGASRANNNQPPILLDAKYEKKADPLIKEQVEKAGARLARVLNEALQ
jgi:hypothetical protein